MEKTPTSTNGSNAERSPGNAEKTIFIKDLNNHDQVRTSFLVQAKQVLQSKNGKPYLSLTLSDMSGAIDTRVWNEAEALATTFDEGDVVAISGRTHVFQNRLQLIVDHLVPVPPEEVDVTHYLPKTSENIDELYHELVETFETLENPWIRKLSLALLNDAGLSKRFKLCPAAKTIHHAFIGGLLTHSVQLVRLVKAVLPYYPDLDRELTLFGAAFHDIGKIDELNYQGGFSYSDEGRLVGHISIGINLVDRKIRDIPEFPQELDWQIKHIILSHHGRLEHGSPKQPHTLEAQLVHYLDDMDSKIDSMQTFMKSEKNRSRWTSLHKAYGQYFYRPDGYLSEE